MSYTVTPWGVMRGWNIRDFESQEAIISFSTNGGDTGIFENQNYPSTVLRKILRWNTRDVGSSFSYYGKR